MTDENNCIIYDVIRYLSRERIFAPLYVKKRVSIALLFLFAFIEYACESKVAMKNERNTRSLASKTAIKTKQTIHNDDDSIWMTCKPGEAFT